MNLDKLFDMYVKKIRAGLITLNDVPEEWRAEVQRRMNM